VAANGAIVDDLDLEIYALLVNQDVFASRVLYEIRIRSCYTDHYFYFIYVIKSCAKYTINEKEKKEKSTQLT